MKAMEYFLLVSITSTKHEETTSFPGSLILPLTGALWGGKMRDPGNEVADAKRGKGVRANHNWLGCFTSDWIKKLREFFKPITLRSNTTKSIA